MNELFTLNPKQERELICSIYEYFTWKTAQEKEKVMTTKKRTRSLANEQKPSNDKDDIIPEYRRYQSIIDVLCKEFCKYKSDFENTKISNEIPRLIKALFVDFSGWKPQKNKAGSSGDENKDSNDRKKLKRQIDKENNNVSDSPNAKKKPRGSIASATDTSTETQQSNKASSVCDNANNYKITNLNVSNKTAPSKTSESLPAQKETSIDTCLPTIDSNDDNAGGGDASKTCDSKDEKKKKKYPSFDERFIELQHFKAGNGHTRVPVRTVLGQWVHKIRGKKREMERGYPGPNPLTEEQIERLDSLGFEWNVAPKAVPFDERLEALMKFKEIEGHCDVPRSYENDKSLGEWVHTLRTNYAKKAKSLTAERIKKLENLGFNWNVLKKKTFEERLEECRHYRRQHGHLKIPPKHKATFENEEQKSFIIWCNQKRYDYKRWKAGRKTRLTTSKIKKLDEIGFEWTRDDVVGYKPRPFAPRLTGKEDWDGRLQELKELKEKVGSCNSLPDFVKAGYTEQSRLYQWMKLQRKKWRLNSLSEEKMNKLKELDFDFHPRRHYAPYGSKKAAAKTHKSIESKKHQSQGDGQCDESATGKCSNSEDETSSESDNDEGKETVNLRNSLATSAHTLYRGFGIDSCRL